MSVTIFWQDIKFFPALDVKIYTDICMQSTWPYHCSVQKEKTKKTLGPCKPIWIKAQITLFPLKNTFLVILGALKLIQIFQFSSDSKCFFLCYLNTVGNVKLHIKFKSAKICSPIKQGTQSLLKQETFRLLHKARTLWSI